jgi:hypothetical protein
MPPDKNPRLDQAVRDQRRRNRLGDEAECQTCGDSTLTHLTKVMGLVLCQCCLALARGRTILEAHHIAGRHEGPTLLVCGNCHGELSDLQRDWPEDASLAERLELGMADIELVLARRDARDE